MERNTRRRSYEGDCRGIMVAGSGKIIDGSASRSRWERIADRELAVAEDEEGYEQQRRRGWMPAEGRGEERAKRAEGGRQSGE